MNWFKRGLKRYDDWCKEMGLTPEQKRSCAPYRKEPSHSSDDSTSVLQPEDCSKKSPNEAV